MPAPSTIAELVKRFEDNLDTYRSGQYNEAQVRQEFLNPLFEALGWDIYNKKGYSDAYKEVIHEAAIKIGGQTKAPDYCFRVGGGKDTYYVEAKKPAVDVAEAISPAYQLRRYAWSAKLPIGILTDFEELAVYDCRIQPYKTDKASTARILLCNYKEYISRWDELYELLSPEAVRRGVLDRFVAGKKAKKGTVEVDAAFLAEIEGWRDVLARHIALRNPGISQRDLNFAVQRIIDRIVFLRICEDRGIEPYGTLQALVNGSNVYRRLGELFERADQRYNSGLFHFTPEQDRTEPPDEVTLALSLDDKPLCQIIERLYYPESPYEFSVLPAEILGQVYEQFLGKVIRLTKGHQAKVEEKPEVRKAGGVYYTPAYIVDYIVRHTVGKLLAERGKAKSGKMTPKEASTLRILDPACGSGSFLLGAYQCLLDWHRDQYVADDAEKHARGREPKLYRSAAGDWRLTTAERKRILLNNVYGVDIDPQAVEVTKLSLLLKVLEGQSKEAINNQLRLFHERALPDLGRNIKCGNSLVGPDFYEGRQKSLFDEEEIYRINAFDWEAEFPEMLRGSDPGFDAVIGNPPWGADIRDIEKAYFREHYTLNVGKYESYVFFIEKVSGLTKGAGVLGMIVPSYWISRSQTKPLRDHLFGNLWPETLIVLPDSVFAKVKMDSAIVVAWRRKQDRVFVAEIRKDELQECGTGAELRARCRPVDIGAWEQRPLLRFNPRITSADARVLRKFERGVVQLGSIVDITQGLTLYRRSTLSQQFGRAKAEEIVSKRLFHSHRKKDKSYKKELLGRDVARYRVSWNGKSWVSYGPWLAHAVDERFFRGPRLVIQKLRNPTLRQRLVVGYLDDNETYSAGVLLNAVLKPNVPYHLFYVMGILNSKAVNYWYRKCVLDVSIRVVDLAHLPIRVLDFGKQSDRERHDRMADLVQGMLSLQKRAEGARATHDKNVFQRQIKTTDSQIDQLVYELYGLTDEEIRVVEEATSVERG